MPTFVIRIIGVNNEQEEFADDMPSLEHAVQTAIIGLATAPDNMIFEAKCVEIYEAGKMDQPAAVIHAMKYVDEQTTVNHTIH